MREYEQKVKEEKKICLDGIEWEEQQLTFTCMYLTLFNWPHDLKAQTDSV